MAERIERKLVKRIADFGGRTNYHSELLTNCGLGRILRIAHQTHLRPLRSCTSRNPVTAIGDAVSVATRSNVARPWSLVRSTQ